VRETIRVQILHGGFRFRKRGKGRSSPYFAVGRIREEGASRWGNAFKSLSGGSGSLDGGELHEETENWARGEVTKRFREERFPGKLRSISRWKGHLIHFGLLMAWRKEGGSNL